MITRGWAALLELTRPKKVRFADLIFAEELGFFHGVNRLPQHLVQTQFSAAHGVCALRVAKNIGQEEPPADRMVVES